MSFFPYTYKSDLVTKIESKTQHNLSGFYLEFKELADVTGEHITHFL